jgi:hypothetical protein
MERLMHKTPPAIGLVAFYAVVYMAAHVADLTFTIYAIEQGIGQEASPIFIWALNYGTMFFILKKLVLAIATAFALAWTSMHLRFAWIAFRLITVYYMVIVTYFAIETHLHLVS